jgi:FG-GAP-like repeat/FG-GAP repeat
MIRVSSRAGLPTVFAAFLIIAAVVIAPCRARAAGGVSAGDEDEDSRLMVMADFNHDGIADIAEAVLPRDGSQAGILKVSLGEADGSFRPVSSSTMLGRAPRAIVAGDFDGDGIPDLIVGDEDGTLTLFRGDGTGTFARAGDIAQLDSVVSIAVADFNQDGRADIAVSDWRGGSVTIFLGTGKGSFRRGWSFRLRMPGTVARVSAADFNGDGIPDLAVIYADEDQYSFDVLLGDGKGVFVHSPKLSYTRDPNSHCPA